MAVQPLDAGGRSGGRGWRRLECLEYNSGDACKIQQNLRSDFASWSVGHEGYVILREGIVVLANISWLAVLLLGLQV